MLQLIALQFGKPILGTLSAIMAGNVSPCPVAFGDYGYQPGFNEAAAKRNGSGLNAFFAECQELSGVLKL